MALNIKNVEAHALARAIAERTGLSLTEAVIQALREKNAALSQARDTEARDTEGRARSLLAYGSRLRRRGSETSSTDELYDELGLPR